MTTRRRPTSRRRTSLFADALLLTIGAALFASGSAIAIVFDPETFALSNGMRVVVVSNHRVPAVTHMVWYMVGSADEGPGETGIAHFLEHLMFKGTKMRAPGEFSDAVAKNGGRENAFTSADYTAYYQTIAVDRLEMVMEMEADRMRNLVITPEQVEPERQVVIEERRSRIDNNPGSILGEQMNAALYLNYPYRNPVIGWRHDIDALDIERILAFYKRWYVPNNAILVVAGDITAEQLKPLAEKYYGVIPRGPEPVRARAKEPPQTAGRRISLKDPRVRQPSWRRSYLAPSLQWGESHHAYSLEVFSDIFGGGTSSRLYASLVVEKKLAVSAGAYYSSDDRGPGRFVVYASPRPGVDLADLEAAVNAEIERAVKNGVSADELSRAKDRMQADAIYARDSLSGGARVLGSALATGISIAESEAWPDRVAAVTEAGIKAAVAYVFDIRRSVTATLLPDRET